MELYQSTLTNKMNEIMKVLAIISTIFIPLSFLAGIWGMNFEHMPELKEPFAYPMALGLMASVTLGLLLWFKIRKWW
jgi:magnesium transporter